MVAPAMTGLIDRADLVAASAAPARAGCAGRALADDVRFRLLVPKGPQRQLGPEETVARFVRWYGEADELWLESSSISAVGDRLVLVFRIRLHDADGWQVIEQHLVADAAPDGRLRAIDLLCTGFHADADGGTSASGSRKEKEEERP